jgi:hypothetical protein
MDTRNFATRRFTAMLSWIIEELGGRGISVLLGLLVGSLVTWIFGRWRRLRERHRILMGDARDTVVINHHLIEKNVVSAGAGGTEERYSNALRIRSLGQAELKNVVPNGHLAAVLLERAFAVSSRNTLISMEDAEGSFLLETLTNFVSDRVANGPFEHDLYVMAPCCEPASLAQHQPITILLISVKDLALFENWPACRAIQVEHGSDGARVLTLMELARRFREEQALMASLRQQGKRTTYVETMYMLDLALDKRSAPLPTKAIPWGRFEPVLKQMNLE